MAKRDGPASRHRIAELSRRAAQHPTVSQLRQPVHQSVVEFKTPCLHKTQRGNRRNPLGHGLDPHDRVLAHRTATDRRHARGDHLGVPSTQDRDPARNRAAVNVTNQQLPQRSAHPGDRATLDREDQAAHADSANARISRLVSGLARTNTGVMALASASEAEDFPDRGHAFLSYVREDSGEADQLQRMLEAAEIPVWRDTASLWPGEDWRARIRNAITHDALVFIACFSRNSAARRTSYQNEELLLAIDQLRLRRPDDPWLIPVRFDNCDIPSFTLGGGRTLASIQRADLFGPGRDLAARRLVASVQRLLTAPEGTCNWIVEAKPRLWLRSGPGFDYPTVDCLDYGQQACGNCTGVKSGGTTWHLLHGNGNDWAWGNRAYLAPLR